MERGRLSCLYKGRGGYTALLAGGLSYDGSRVLKAKSLKELYAKAEAAERNDWWVTMNGSHVLIKGNEIVGGAGGRLNGKTFGTRFQGKYRKSGYLRSEGRRGARGSATGSDGLGQWARPAPQRISKISEVASRLDEIGFKDVDMKSLRGLSAALVVESVNRLAELEAKFGAVRSIGENENAWGNYMVGIGVEDLGYQTVAYVEDYGNGYVALKLSKSAYKDKLGHKRDTRYSVEEGHHMPCAPEFYATYTIAHEYAHLLQNALYFRERKKFRDKTEKAGRKLWPDERIDMGNAIRYQMESRCIREIERIGRRSDPKFKLIDHLSKYGQTNYAEAFAEMFANSQCGKPNAAGEAMNIWLKEKGFLK